MDRSEILARLRERIFRFAASRLSREAAEDVAQEVLLLLHEKYAAVDRLEELVPLALEITRFKILSTRRKVVRRGEIFRFRSTIFRWLAPMPTPSIKRPGASRSTGWKSLCGAWANDAANYSGSNSPDTPFLRSRNE